MVSRRLAVVVASAGGGGDEGAGDGGCGEDDEERSVRARHETVDILSTRRIARRSAATTCASRVF
jgi:hypothetical protein